MGLFLFWEKISMWKPKQIFTKLIAKLTLCQWIFLTKHQLDLL